MAPSLEKVSTFACEGGSCYGEVVEGRHPGVGREVITWEMGGFES